jgi:hypothetical protein
MKPAQDIVVGDVLLAANIPANTDPSTIDWTTWSTENLILNETNFVETTVVSVGSRPVTQAYLINGDLFSQSHYILTKKDGVSRFIKASDMDNSYLVYNRAEQGFVNITEFEVLDYEDTVFSINCEPYDNFFTQNMLVFDTKDPQ